jgi:GT2 family glycosyltransferase
MFDPVFFVYFDDVDLAVRVRRAGFSYWLEPSAVLVHKASALTGGKRSEFTLTWTSRNWPLLVRLRQRGLARIAGLLYVQLWVAGRFLLRRDDLRLFLLRQRQFRAALRVGPISPVPRP